MFFQKQVTFCKQIQEGIHFLCFTLLTSFNITFLKVQFCLPLIPPKKLVVKHFWVLHSLPECPTCSENVNLHVFVFEQRMIYLIISRKAILGRMQIVGTKNVLENVIGELINKAKNRGLEWFAVFG